MNITKAHSIVLYIKRKDGSFYSMPCGLPSPKIMNEVAKNGDRVIDFIYAESPTKSAHPYVYRDPVRAAQQLHAQQFGDVFHKALKAYREQCAINGEDPRPIPEDFASIFFVFSQSVVSPEQQTEAGEPRKEAV